MVKDGRKGMRRLMNRLMTGEEVGKMLFMLRLYVRGESAVNHDKRAESTIAILTPIDSKIQSWTKKRLM